MDPIYVDNKMEIEPLEYIAWIHPIYTLASASLTLQNTQHPAFIQQINIQVGLKCHSLLNKLIGKCA